MSSVAAGRAKHGEHRKPRVRERDGFVAKNVYILYLDGGVFGACEIIDVELVTRSAWFMACAHTYTHSDAFNSRQNDE